MSDTTTVYLHINGENERYYLTYEEDAAAAEGLYPVALPTPVVETMRAADAAYDQANDALQVAVAAVQAADIEPLATANDWDHRLTGDITPSQFEARRVGCDHANAVPRNYNPEALECPDCARSYSPGRWYG